MKEPRSITPGIRIRRPARTRIRIMKRRVRDAVTTPNVKSLWVDGVSRYWRMGGEVEDYTYHGIPTRSWFWTVINQANMPRTVAAAASITKIQRLSWISGQWYLRRVSRTVIISVAMSSTKWLRCS